MKFSFCERVRVSSQSNEDNMRIVWEWVSLFSKEVEEKNICDQLDQIQEISRNE